MVYIVFSFYYIHTDFPNVWGECKDHGNPYIHSTTVQCNTKSIFTAVTHIDHDEKGTGTWWSPSESILCRKTFQSRIYQTAATLGTG